MFEGIKDFRTGYVLQKNIFQYPKKTLSYCQTFIFRNNEIQRLQKQQFIKLHKFFSETFTSLKNMGNIHFLAKQIVHIFTWL